MNDLMMVKNVDWVRGALFGTLLAGFYYPAYSWMLRWWNRDDFNYCYLIPIVVGYLIWEKRADVLKQVSTPSWLGMIPFLSGLVMFWLGELGGEYYTLYLSSWFVLIGLIWMHIGWQKLKNILFPLFLLLTMFPPPSFIYNNLSLKLKLISSQISLSVIQALGITSFREGNVIDLGFTQLQVVDACSGLRYLIPLIVLSLLLAFFSKTTLWKRIFIVLSSIPISIIVNSLRIVLVAVLYPVWGPKVVEGFFHDFSGWFLFMVSIGILLLEIWVLGKIGKAPEILTDKKSERNDRLTNVRLSSTSRFFIPQFIVCMLLLSVTLVLSYLIEFREKVPIAKSFDQYPMHIANWTGKREGIEQKFIDKLNFSDHVNVNYQNPNGQSVNLYVAYYESQRKGESIHSPGSCLPSSGWVFHESGKKSVQIDTQRKIEIPVNRAFVQKGDYKQLSYYWFPMRGRVLTNIWEMKLFNFWDALIKKRTDGALVRLITPVYNNEEIEIAEKRLQKFMGEMLSVLDEFLPK